MSKPVNRVAISVLISLAVIFAIYMTVQAASLNLNAEKAGSHAVGGVLTNFNHDRLTVSEQGQYQPQSGSYQNPAQDSGHGCDSEKSTSPID